MDVSVAEYRFLTRLRLAVADTHWPFANHQTPTQAATYRPTINARIVHDTPEGQQR